MIRNSIILFAICVLCIDVSCQDAPPCFFLSNKARVHIPCLPADWLIDGGGSFNGIPLWLPLDDNTTMARGCNEPNLPKPKASDRRQNVIAVAQRGGCSFASKAMTAMRLGAIGLIIVNFDSHDMIPMGALASDSVKLSQFSAVMVPSNWLPNEVTASWSTLGDDSNVLEDNSVGFHYEPCILNVSTQIGGKLAAVAAELSREGRNDDALMQLDAAVRASPSDVSFLLQRLWLRQDLCAWHNIELLEKEFEEAITKSLSISKDESVDFAALCPKLSPSLGLSPKLVESVCHLRSRELERNANLSWSAAQLDTSIRTYDNVSMEGPLRIQYASSFLRKRHPLRYLLEGLPAAHSESESNSSVAVSCLHIQGPSERDILALNCPNEVVLHGGLKTQVRLEPESVVSEVFLARREGQPHVLIDLDGHTRSTNHLPGLLAYSLAPVQIHYLGTPHYPTALPNCQFYLSSVGLTPPEYYPKSSRGHVLSERLLILPHYMVYKPPQDEVINEMAHTPFTRTEEERRTNARDQERRKLGIGSDWFVYACFNQGKKIDAIMFSTWIGLLARFQEYFGADQRAVLWLPQVDKTYAQQSLKGEAASKGLSPSHLIFSGKRVSNREEHLARLAAADVALDSARYSAGSVGVEAFLQGIPLVVLASDSSVASRQATATALTLSDNRNLLSRKQVFFQPSLLVVASFKEYSDIALRLASKLRSGNDIISLAHVSSTHLLNQSCGAAPHKCALKSNDRVRDIERGAAAAFEAKKSNAKGHVFTSRSSSMQFRA